MKWYDEFDVNYVILRVCKDNGAQKQHLLFAHLLFEKKKGKERVKKTAGYEYHNVTYCHMQVSTQNFTAI